MDASDPIPAWRLKAAGTLLTALRWQVWLWAVAAEVLFGLARVLGRTWRALPALGGAGFAVVVGTGACGPFDLSCKIDAWQEGWLEGLQATFASTTASMLEGVFTSSISTLGTQSWNVGITTVNRLGAVMAIVVVALCGVQVGVTLLAGQRGGIARAVFGAVLAWPVCAASVWLTIRVVTVADGLAAAMIENSTALTTLSSLVDMAWVGSLAIGGGAGAALVSLFFLFMVFIPTVLLTLVMAFRNYALVVAIAVAPVSLMVWGLAALRGMGRGWVKITVALMLTKPVMAIAILIAGEMVGAGLSGGGIGPFMTGVVGIFMAAFAPLLAMGMVTGAMAIGDAAITRGAEQRIGRAGVAAVGRGARGVSRTGWQKAKPHLSHTTSGIRSRMGGSVNSFFGGAGSRPGPGPQPGSGPQGSPGPAGGGSTMQGAPQAGSGQARGKEAGDTAGAGVGGATGGALGSVVPGVGTAVGGTVGSAVGSAVGRGVGGGIGGVTDAGVDSAQAGAGVAPVGHDGGGGERPAGGDLPGTGSQSPAGWGEGEGEPATGVAAQGTRPGERDAGSRPSVTGGAGLMEGLE